MQKYIELILRNITYADSNALEQVSDQFFATPVPQVKSYHGLYSNKSYKTSIRSAGVTPEVNLRIKQAKKHAKEIHPRFETQADNTRTPKQGYQWPHRKD